MSRPDDTSACGVAVSENYFSFFLKPWKSWDCKGAVGFSLSISQDSVGELENVILLKEKIHKTKRFQIRYTKKETLMILQAKFLMLCVS